MRTRSLLSLLKKPVPRYLPFSDTTSTSAPFSHSLSSGSRATSESYTQGWPLSSQRVPLAVTVRIG